MGGLILGVRPAFATDFGEYPLGAQLKDFGWTEQGAAGGTLTDGSYAITAYDDSISGRGVLVTQGNVDQYRAITWDQVGTVTDCEILALIRLDQLPNAVGGGGVCRVNGSSGGYDGVFDSDGSPDEVHASRFTNGFFDTVVGPNTARQDLTLDTTSKFWLRFRINGTTIGIKCWADGGAEPASFGTGVDTTYTSGKVGIQTVEKRNFRVYWFAVALNGGTAPFPNG